MQPDGCERNIVTIFVCVCISLHVLSLLYNKYQVLSVWGPFPSAAEEFPGSTAAAVSTELSVACSANQTDDAVGKGNQVE